jgi:hypothetical protein
MRTYVSIDIDFFNGMSPDVVESTLDNFFASAVRKRIPIVAVMNHQQLTRFVDKSRANVLINVDQHADVVSVTEATEYNCGTWISYVRWRHRGHYHWIHRHSVDAGECSWDRPVFMGGRTRGRNTDWKRVSRRHVQSFPQTRGLLKDCVAIGFVLSPFYVKEELEPVFRTLVNRYDMRYIKGVRGEEDFAAKRRPVRPRK